MKDWIDRHMDRMPDYLIRDLPPFASAMAVAELLYKFGSFALECLAFLATWYVLAIVYRGALAWGSDRRLAVPPSERP